MVTEIVQQEAVTPVRKRKTCWKKFDSTNCRHAFAKGIRGVCPVFHNERCPNGARQKNTSFCLVPQK